jgi:hypothetical protein
MAMVEPGGSLMQRASSSFQVLLKPILTYREGRDW